MRLAYLYLCSRQAGRTIAVLVAVAAVAWLWLRWDSASTITVTIVPIAIPLAAAMMVGASAGSPFGESEATGARPLWPLRGGHLLGLVAIAVAALALVVLRWSVPDGVWALARNLAGFTGLALLTARVLGAGLSWIVPLGYAIFLFLAPQSGERPAPWTWPALEATDHMAALIALALLLAGLVVVALSGARDTGAGSAAL